MARDGDSEAATRGGSSARRRSAHAAIALALCAGSFGCFRDWSQFEHAPGGDAGVVGDGGAFRHPGVLVDSRQLDFVAAKIAAGAAPWTDAFARLRASHGALPSDVPHAQATVDCSGTSTDPGCANEVTDAITAYTQALIWYFTRDRSYAQRVVAILNAWSALSPTHTGDSAAVQIAWAAEVFTRAAEIVRYTYDGWPAAESQRFGAMLANNYLPTIVNGWYGGNNWNMSMVDASMNIAVFNDDRAGFDQAVALWRSGVAAYFYLHTDGALPARPSRGSYTDAQVLSLWHGQTTFVDGLSMDTCANFGSVALGTAATIDAAETARLQGVDLYREQATRLGHAFEFHAQYLNGATVPGWLCGGHVDLSGQAPALTYEIGYNALVNRLDMALPNTLAWITTNRPTGAGLHMDWETLTHAESGAADAP